MFLSHIHKNKLAIGNLQKITHLKSIIKKVKNRALSLKKIKQSKNFKSLRFLLMRSPKPNVIFKSKSLLNYIIGVSIYNTKIVLHLSDIKGTVKFFITSGSLSIGRKQKRKKIAVLIKLMKFMLLKINFVSKDDLIALHLKNFNDRLGSITSSFLSKYYNIQLVRINSNQPHNGCRPRKMKRKKRRNISFDKKK